MSIFKTNKLLISALVVFSLLFISVGLVFANTITILGSPSDNAYFAGNVGIGVVNPTAFNLEVSDNAKINGTLQVPMLKSPDVNDVLVVADAEGNLSSKNVADVFSASGATIPAAIVSHGRFGQLYGDSSPYTFNGNVGIGTLSPTAKLEVVGNLKASGSITFPNLAGATTQVVTVSNTGVLSATSTIAGGYWTASGNNIYSSNSGNVGVGTTNPTKKLNIYMSDGTSGFRTSLICSNATTNKLITSADGTIICGTDQTGAGSGNIVDTLAATLQASNNANGYGMINLGNVGIGVASPSYNLDVSNGNIAAGAFIYNSDLALKNNIKGLDGALDKILKLRGVSFNWKKDGAPGLGLIAQEVEQIFPELVTADNNGLKGVQYGNLVAPLIEAIKSQQLIINEQQMQIKNISARLEALESNK